MAYASCHMDPASVNDASPKATVGGLYGFESNGNPNSTPTGVYRYIQITDAASNEYLVTNGAVLCPDNATGVANLAATGDRSGDVTGQACCGVAVRSITNDYYGYILVKGRHQAILTDGSVTLGDPLVVSATDGLAHAGTVTATGTDIEHIFGVALENDSSAAVVAADIKCI